MSHQSMIDAAKSVVLAYSNKDWSALYSSVSPGIFYDEVPTLRNRRGVDRFVACMQEWATAFPDMKGTIRNATVLGDHVSLEIVWAGTHTGPLESPGGTIYPTGKNVEIPARLMVEVVDEEVKTITHYFDLEDMIKRIELTPEERAA